MTLNKSLTKINMNSNNKTYIIYILVFLCVLFAIYLYVSNNTSNNSETTYYVNSRNHRDNSNNIWYGLNAGGGYRGYGREYGGHLSPGRIYGHEESNEHRGK